MRTRRSSRTLAYVFALVGLLSATAPTLAAEYAFATQRGGQAFDALIDGDHVYVGQGSTLVTLTGGVALASQAVPGQIRGIAKTLDRIYVAWDGRFSDIRVSEYSLETPERPRLLGPINVPGLDLLVARDVAVIGDTLYALASDLVAIDVSDPDRPILGSSATGLVGQLEVVGTEHLLAFGTDPGGILFGRIYDVSSPLAPQIGDYFGTISNNPGFASRDGLVAFFSNGFQLFDFTDPANPSYLGDTSVPSVRSGLLLAYHVILAVEGELQVWDISEPTTPVEVSSVPIPIGRPVLATSPDGDRAYVFDEDGLALELGLSDPEMPQVTQVTDLPVGGSPAHVAQRGSDLLIGQAWGELRLTNAKLATLGAFEPVADIETLGLAVDGDWALLADAGVGIHYVDISDPDTPQVLGTVPVDYPIAPVLDGDRGWALNRLDSLLLTLDLSQPASPQITHSLDFAGISPSLHLEGDRLYAATDITTTGLRIFDVSGAVPVEIGAYTGCQASRVDVQDTLAAVGCRERELHLLDLSDPSQPTLLGVYFDADQFVPRPLSVLFVEDDLVFVGYAGGVDVVDVSDPTSPQRVQRFEIGGWIEQMIPAAGGGVWAAGQDGGLARLKESGAILAPHGLDKPSTSGRRVD